MYTNGNLEAHVAALLLLGSVALVLGLAAAGMLLFFTRRQWVRYPMLGMAVVLLSYGMLLAGFAVFSHERTLDRGQEKHFCELDCHMAYSVQNVEHAKSIGNVSAQGDFAIITLRSRFDEATIAPWRGREMPLIPNRLRAAIVDSQGRKYAISGTGQGAWDAAHGHEHSLTDCLRPGESYETTLVFDVPVGVSSPRLLLSGTDTPSVVLIGDEDNLGHGKTYLAL